MRGVGVQGCQGCQGCQGFRGVMALQDKLSDMPAQTFVQARTEVRKWGRSISSKWLRVPVKASSLSRTGP